MPRRKGCKDCTPRAKRDAPYPGPRCFTHHRENKQRQAKRAHELKMAKTYGLKPGEYELLRKSQRGVCVICQRATGARKRLAVDHNHKTGEVRGLLCGVCNSMLAHVRDDPMVFYRAAEYLLHPPAREVLGHVEGLDS